MSVILEIKGIEELEIVLKKNAELELVKEIVKVNGGGMHKKTKRYAPVDTSFLEGEIKLDISQDGLSAKVSGCADYDPYQELGTRFMSGTPHFKPAFKEQCEVFKNDLRKLVKE